MDGKLRFTYNDIHMLIKSRVPIIDNFKPDVIIAVGTGGFIPARMLKEHLKIPLYAVIIKHYDDTTDTANEAPEKIQWLSDAQLASLKGKRVLIVDEIDDTRKTMAFCANEIKREVEPETVGIFVVHNKDTKKIGALDDDIVYISGQTIPNRWAVYPWEVEDILDHDAKSQVVAN